MLNDYKYDELKPILNPEAEILKISENKFIIISSCKQKVLKVDKIITLFLLECNGIRNVNEILYNIVKKYNISDDELSYFKKNLEKILVFLRYIGIIRIEKL